MPTATLIRLGYYHLTFEWQGPSSPLDGRSSAGSRAAGLLTDRGQLFIFRGVTVSLVVWLAALPLVMLRFHLVSPIGILLNIPLVLLTSAALLTAGLSSGLSVLWEPLGRLWHG